MLTLPKNSIIRIQSKPPGKIEIIIPQPKGSGSHFLAAAFLIFWLGVWSVGLTTIAADLIRNDRVPDLFLICWLGIWTITGILGVYYLYRIFTPGPPEKMILSDTSMCYDSGVPPFHFSFRIRQKLVHEQVITEFDRSDFKSLSLKEAASGKQLTVDQGNRRYSLAPSVSEAEREWLFKVLHDRYQS